MRALNLVVSGADAAIWLSVVGVSAYVGVCSVHIKVYNTSDC